MAILSKGCKPVNFEPQFEPPPRDIEIPGWCPAGPVLPHGEKVPLKPWLATHPGFDLNIIK